MSAGCAASWGPLAAERSLINSPWQQEVTGRCWVCACAIGAEGRALAVRLQVVRELLHRWCTLEPWALRALELAAGPGSACPLPVAAPAPQPSWGRSEGSECLHLLGDRAQTRKGQQGDQRANIPLPGPSLPEGSLAPEAPGG